MIVDVHSAAGTTIDVWLQERIVFEIASAAGSSIKMYTNISGSLSSPIATYTTPASGVLYVDMSDYIRTYRNVTSITFLGSSPRTIGVNIAGLINPRNVVIPYNWIHAIIVPPSRMIKGTAGQVIAEFYNFNDGGYLVSGAAWTTSKRGLSVQEDTFTIYRQLSPLTYSKKFTMSQRQCGVRYAVVEWVSFSGAQRRHIFEVVKNKSNTADAYSLLPTDNEYVEIKGRNDGFSLRIDGLDAYDMWYYSDILHSSNVKVSLNGTDYDRVQITDKSITLPDGDAGVDGKLTISVNWKRYDAVAL